MNEYLSIAEAAKELGKSEASVFRACLDEQLTLSVRFSGRNLPYAKLRERVPMEACFPPKRFKTAPLGLYGQTIMLQNGPVLWRLVMAGSGRLCVEDEYERASGRAPVANSESSPGSTIGIFVSDPDMSIPRDDELVLLYELQEYRGDAPAPGPRDNDDFHSAKCLPAGSELVIGRSALAEYVAKIAAVSSVQAPETAPPEEATGSAPPPDDGSDSWKAKARQIADECFDRDTANQCRDSLAGYARRVRDEMQKREIHGPRGRIDNVNTVQREALQGGEWWSKKAK
jgi:hypothetical protein